jgi:hypothetical protein
MTLAEVPTVWRWQPHDGHWKKVAIRIAWYIERANDASVHTQGAFHTLPSPDDLSSYRFSLRDTLLLDEAR